MKGYRKILIAVNGSIDLFKYGLNLARDEQTWITVLKVIPPFEGDLNLTGIKNIGDVLDSGGGKTISEINETAKSEKALVKIRLEEGKVHEEIVKVAEEEKCDLIIMGEKNKKTLIKRLLGDDIVSKVANHSPCPVLVVKS